MDSEQKLKLAKTIIACSYIMLTVIAIVWLVVTHNPSAFSTTLNYDEKTIEFDCSFYDNQTAEQVTPDK